MYSKTDNIEIMINHNAIEFLKELFDSLKNRFQNNLESMKGSKFIFDHVYLLYYKCHKKKPNCSGSYINSPDLLKIKKSNNKSHQLKKDNKYFQYTVTVELKHEESTKKIHKN